MRSELIFREHLLATLATGHAVLLGLAELGGRLLLLLLGLDDGVSEGVVLDLLLGSTINLVDTSTVALALCSVSKVIPGV